MTDSRFVVSDRPGWVEAMCALINRHAARPESAGQVRVRFPLHDCQAILRRLSDPDDVFQVNVIDVSSTGVGLETEIPLDVGTVYLIEFVEADAAAAHWQIRVRRVDHLPDGRYHVGATLDAGAAARGRTCAAEIGARS